MKFNILFMIVFSLSFLIINCTSNANKNEGEKVKETKTDATVKPQYEITVFQNNKEMGKIVLELYPDVAPLMCKNFDSLVSIGFYDGTAFHRVIPGFMIQGGDPNSKNKSRETWGMGDPSQTKVKAEFNDISHKRGILSTARSQDPNSASSQFFIMVKDNPGLDRQYTVFGHVLSGMDVVDAVVNVPCNGPQHSSPVDKIEMKIKKIK